MARTKIKLPLARTLLASFGNVLADTSFSKCTFTYPSRAWRHIELSQRFSIFFCWLLKLAPPLHVPPPCSFGSASSSLFLWRLRHFYITITVSFLSQDIISQSFSIVLTKFHHSEALFWLFLASTAGGQFFVCAGWCFRLWFKVRASAARKVNRGQTRRGAGEGFSRLTSRASVSNTQKIYQNSTSYAS